MTTPIRAADLPGGSVVVDDLKGIAWYANGEPGLVGRWDETSAGEPVDDAYVDRALRYGAVVLRVSDGTEEGR